MLAGIVLAVVLSQNTQIFHPRASEVSTQQEKEIRDLTGQLKSYAGTSFRLPFFQVSEEDLLSIASQRKKLLIDNIKTNPEVVLENKISQKEKAVFSEEVKKLIESEIAEEGDLTVYHLDYPNPKDNTLRFTFRSLKDQKEYQLFLPKSKQDIISSKASITGVVLDSYIALDNINFDPEEVKRNLLTTGEREVLFVLVDFPNLKHQSNALEYFRGQISGSSPNSLVNYYKKISYDKLTFKPTFAPKIYQVSTEGACLTWEWTAEVDRSLKQDLDLSIYQRIVYIFPKSGACPYLGEGTVGGNPARSFIYNYDAEIFVYISFNRVLAHELGHNLGLFHANYLNCKDKLIGLIDSCIIYQSGDSIDLMGSSNVLDDINYRYKEILGWTDPQNIKQVGVNSDGFFTLYSQGINDNRPKALKIGLNNPSGRSYYISYRIRGNEFRDVLYYIKEGITIHLVDPNFSLVPSLLIPPLFDENNRKYPVLKDGKEFYDPINKVRITQISHDYEKVNLLVDIISPRDKYGVNLRAYLAKNPSSSDKLSVILSASLDISSKLNSIPNTKVRSVIGEGKVITADTQASSLSAIAGLDEVSAVDLPVQLDTTAKDCTGKIRDDVFAVDSLCPANQSKGAYFRCSDSNTKFFNLSSNSCRWIQEWQIEAENNCKQKHTQGNGVYPIDSGCPDNQARGVTFRCEDSEDANKFEELSSTSCRWVQEWQIEAEKKCRSLYCR